MSKNWLPSVISWSKSSLHVHIAWVKLQSGTQYYYLVFRSETFPSFQRYQTVSNNSAYMRVVGNHKQEHLHSHPSISGATPSHFAWLVDPFLCTPCEINTKHSSHYIISDVFYNTRSNLFSFWTVFIHRFYLEKKIYSLFFDSYTGSFFPFVCSF